MKQWKRNLAVLVSGAALYITGALIASKQHTYPTNEVSVRLEEIAEVPETYRPLSTKAVAGVAASGLGLAGLLIYGTIRKRKQ